MADDPTPTPTPEPVMNLAQIEQAVTGIVTTTVVLLKAFGVWDPTPDQLAAMLAAVAAYLAVIAPIIRFRFVRAKVVPVSKVAAIKPEYEGDPPTVDAGAVIVKDSRDQPNPERLTPCSASSAETPPVSPSPAPSPPARPRSRRR